jgi:hypothetical protein
VLYCNSGDWVESCTALVEHFEGRLELVSWIVQRSFDPLGIEMASGFEQEEDVLETVEEPF